MRQLFRGILGFVIACGLRSGGAAADPAPTGEEDSVRVFRDVQPSVVSLQNAEASGTGIVIDASGLILTNAHVVISPLPFKCVADVVDLSGKSKQAEFKKVQIVGYHPHLDLALVRVDPKEAGARLKAAVIASAQPSPGQHVFVIGNPAGGGMILTKTITAGMLSAVDREVEGEKYDQIDAAINPGNSGGPLVDRFGHVLGVVTFKFTDVQAIGFAIPIQGLKTSEFVSLNQRKGNPDRAKEFITLAQRFSGMARDAGTSRTVRVRQPGVAGTRIVRQAGDEKERLVFASYAAMCYRLALTYDPGNSVTWYNVADALVAIKEYESSAAYMLRHIQLNPWGSPNGNAYRELGLALVNLKRPDDAIAAYQEGVAKFPFSGRIWFDLAIAQKDKNNLAEASYNSAVALAAGVPPTITHNVRNLQTQLTQGLAETARKDLDARTAADLVRTKLEKLLADSNKARQAHTVYLTAGFITYAKATDGPVPDGVKEHIPQDLQTAPPASGAGSGTAVSSGVPPRAGTVDQAPAAALTGNAALDGLRDGQFTKPHASASSTTYLKAVSSSRRDFIGQGQTFNYQGAAIKAVGGAKLISLDVDGWRIHFAPPRGKDLGLGEYPDAKRWPFHEDSPGLDFSGHGRGSNQVSGKFVIWELETQDGKVIHLAVDFIFHSEVKGPPLYGMIRYNSSLE